MKYTFRYNQTQMKLSIKTFSRCLFTDIISTFIYQCLFSQNEVELGELLLSLNYLPSAGRLNVDIIRAKQLLQTDMCQGSGESVFYA